jgi:hypothetical protein
MATSFIVSVEREMEAANEKGRHRTKRQIEGNEAHRPEALVVVFDEIPAELKKFERWVLWRYEWRSGAWSKVPYQPNGARANTNDPETWSDFATVQALYKSGKYDGVGIVLGDGLVGIDLDDCRDPETGNIEQWALDIVDGLASYSEVSPSGTGLKVFCLGCLPPGGRRRGNIELYDSARYFTVTGRHGERINVEERTEALARLHAAVFADQQKKPAERATGGNGTALDDEEIIKLARAATNGAKFTALWSGDTSAYDADESRADLAFLCLLAFYTRDTAQLDRLFRRSGLMRGKWEREDYRVRTLAAAISTVAETYTAHHVGEKTEKVAERAGRGDGGDDCVGRSGHRRRGQADELVELADKLELYHDGGTAYADVRIDGRRETWALSSRACSNFLRRAYYLTHGRAPHAQALADARALLIACALYDGPERRVYLRVAEHEEVMYLDLGDDGWRAVEVTRDGWRILEDPPVRFRRSATAFALPEPVRGGSVDEIRDLLNVASEDDLRLLIAWMLGALSPRSPYPVLVLHGEQGSAKTTTARLVRSLVDPSRSPVRAAPRDVTDVMVAARHGHVVALDNLSHISAELSDAICRLSTGGGFGRRELYTDMDEVIIDAIRPVILTGIEELPTRGDLLDRSLLVTLPAIDDSDRRTETEYWRDAESRRPRILGALLEALVCGLAGENAVAGPLPRMADWYCLVAAAEPALGWEPGTLRRTYIGVRDLTVATALESSPVASLLLDLALPWSGTSTDLLGRLSDRADERTRRSRSWPKSARGLRGILTRLAPALRAVGIDIDQPRSGRERRHLYLRRRDVNPSFAPSPPSPQAPTSGMGSDRRDGGDGHFGTPTGEWEEYI